MRVADELPPSAIEESFPDIIPSTHSRRTRYRTPRRADSNESTRPWMAPTEAVVADGSKPA
jgi:hypothetical protein